MADEYEVEQAPKVRKFKPCDEANLAGNFGCGICLERFELYDMIYRYGLKDGSGLCVCYRHYGENIEGIDFTEFDEPWIES